jgi:phosphoserine aminotransferase
MSRVFNFSAGPATLPADVLIQAREELLDWGGQGMSVMEMSHRSKAFIGIAEKAESDLRELLAIPDNFKVLFLQGGATLQFATVALNLANQDSIVDYAVTGSWSKKALAEARRFANANVALNLAESGIPWGPIPEANEWSLSDDAAYLHYCANETIAGIEFAFVPSNGACPVVSDMSSTLLSRPIDVDRFGVIYAGAQKNIGPAGLTIVVVREDLLGRARSITPTLLDYAVMAESGSMSNTPPTFAWYMAGLVFAWLKSEGGLSVVAERNARKAEKLYTAIDESDFYSNPVHPSCRSRMNVPFTLADSALDPVFLAEADKRGLSNLKGHRSVGGMRASIYNAMPEAGIDALLEFMREFENTHA